MDRSYRLKMEEKINSNTLTIEYVINCIAKNEDKINKLAYKEKQYRNTNCNNYKIELDELIAYRQPFIDLLMKDCKMSLDDIKNAVANVKEKNIPNKDMCNRIREIIVSGSYGIEKSLPHLY